MNVYKESFGFTKEGVEVFRFIIKNDNGMEAHFTNYGANIISIIVADREGHLDDVMLGYDDIAGYEDNSPGFGSFIGRHANRIKNGRFELNGVTYQLDKNNGNNNLHGGNLGYNTLVYDAKIIEEDNIISVEFSRTSPHMEQGFPGNLDIRVKYSITNDSELIIQYYAISDQDTIVNFTNHSYFNLSGHDSGLVLNQKFWLDSDAFTITDKELIPTGEIAYVTDTPMDFRELKALGQDIEADYEPLKIGGGYDHNYILKTSFGQVEKVAKLVDDISGRVMEVYTDMPGVQLYTGNFLSKRKGKQGAVYDKRHGVCFETQYYPNSINTPEFPSCILRANDEFESETIYKFLLQ